MEGTRAGVILCKACLVPARLSCECCRAGSHCIVYAPRLAGQATSSSPAGAQVTAAVGLHAWAAAGAGGAARQPTAHDGPPPSSLPHAAWQPAGARHIHTSARAALNPPCVLCREQLGVGMCRRTLCHEAMHRGCTTSGSSCQS